MIVESFACWEVYVRKKLSCVDSAAESRIEVKTVTLGRGSDVETGR